MSAAAPAVTWTDRQLPVDEEVFLDHVGLFVRDLDAAGAVGIWRLSDKLAAERRCDRQAAAVGNVEPPGGDAARLYRDPGGNA